MPNTPELEHSLLSQSLSSDGKTVQVLIYRLVGEDQWALEVEDEFSNSTVWDDKFDSDAQALEEIKQAIQVEGISAFIGPAGRVHLW